MLLVVDGFPKARKSGAQARAVRRVLAAARKRVILAVSTRFGGGRVDGFSKARKSGAQARG